MNLQQITTTTGQVASFSQPLTMQPDPLQSFRALTNQGQMALLLESAEIDSKNSLKSLMLIDAALRIECNGQQVCIEALSSNGLTLLTFLADLLSPIATLTYPHVSGTGLTSLLALKQHLLANAAA